jgi:hypothetical protein
VVAVKNDFTAAIFFPDCANYTYPGDRIVAYLGCAREKVLDPETKDATDVLELFYRNPIYA